MMEKTYRKEIIIKNMYFDVIDLMGEDGLHALLDRNELLATMAAPITRLDFENTKELNAMMMSVRKYMKSHHRWQNLTREGLVRRLMYDWVGSISEEEGMAMMSSFRLIEGFDEEGNALFNEAIYKQYCIIMKNDRERKIPYDIKYGAIHDVNGSSRGGIRWEDPKYDNTRTYYSHEVDGYWTVDHEITEDEWYLLLKERTTGKLRNVLMAYLQLEDHRASPLMIERMFGIDFHSVNNNNILLGRRAKTRMNIEVFDRADKSRCWSVAMNRGRSEASKGFVWEMRPELVAAVKRISAEENWTPATRKE